MKRKPDERNGVEKKSFFTGIFERLDKKMQERAKSAPCCCKPPDKDKGDSSCCG